MQARNINVFACWGTLIVPSTVLLGAVYQEGQYEIYMVAHSYNVRHG